LAVSQRLLNLRGVHKNKNTVVPQLRSSGNNRAKNISISLYPEQLDVLARRSRELSVSKSVLFQLYLDMEQRDGLLFREVKQRLSRRESAPSKPLPTATRAEPAAEHCGDRGRSNDNKTNQQSEQRE
jgi:hypothetical protein